MAPSAAENMKEAFDAFTRGDMETVSRFIDPDLTVDDRVLPEANPTERGVEALIANTKNVREVFGDASWEATEIMEVGDHVLVRVRVTGTARSVDLPMSDDLGQVFTLKDGRAVKMDVFRTWEEARAFVGLGE